MAATLHPAAIALSSASASIQPNPLAALLTTSAIAPLSSIGWIRVTGPDRVRWLNGMVTNSIQDLAPSQGCYNFVLNSQGRILGDLTAFAPEADPLSPQLDPLLLETSLGQVPNLIALLDRFIIMDDVELADISSVRTGLAVIGPHAANLLQHLGLPIHLLMPMTMQFSSWRGASVLTLHQYSPLVPRFELWAEPAITELARQALLASGATLVSSEAMEYLRILEGTPLYGADIRNTETARDLPQETAPIGLTPRALHFAKGCYLGQEIVERIRSRGAVHRAFTGFELTGALPGPGALLTDAAGKAVAELTSVASIPGIRAAVDGEPNPLQLALGYIRREALVPQTTPLHYPGGVAIPISLPLKSHLLLT